MRKARLLISGTHVHEYFPLPRAVSTHRFFPKGGLLGTLMKPTHYCSGPLESQACPIHRYWSLVCRKLQIGNRRMTLGWAIIVKGRLKLHVRITWMVLHLTQRLLNCDVRDGVLLSLNHQNRRRCLWFLLLRRGGRMVGRLDAGNT